MAIGLSFTIPADDISLRQSNPDQLRPVKITPDFIATAEGSVLIELGNTRVICTATVDDGVPGFLKGSGKGWVTSEYGMLPRATEDALRVKPTGKQSGRTLEIQRLIGRSLRAATDRKPWASAPSGLIAM